MLGRQKRPSWRPRHYIPLLPSSAADSMNASTRAASRVSTFFSAASNGRLGPPGEYRACLVRQRAFGDHALRERVGIGFHG
jgi:hypothetical protein